MWFFRLEAVSAGGLPETHDGEPWDVDGEADPYARLSDATNFDRFGVRALV